MLLLLLIPAGALLAICVIAPTYYAGLPIAVRCLMLAGALCAGWKAAIVLGRRIRTTANINHFWHPALTRRGKVLESWPVRARVTERAGVSLAIAFALVGALTMVPLSFSFRDYKFHYVEDWRSWADLLAVTVAVRILAGTISFESSVEFGETQLWHRCPWGSHWTYFKSIQRIYIQPTRSKWLGRAKLILMSRNGIAELDRVDQQFIDRLTAACPNARVGNDEEMARQWRELPEAEWLGRARAERGSVVEEESSESVW
jgi:hypothetical protein